MQQIWGASGDFWHHYWQVMYNWFGGSDILITCIGMLHLILVVYLDDDFAMVYDIANYSNVYSLFVEMMYNF